MAPPIQGKKGPRVFDAEKHCGAQKIGAAKGDLCCQPKGWGVPGVTTGRCKRHGGLTPNHKVSTERQMARQACATLGLAVVMDPAEALLSEVYETLANREFYRALVQQLPTHPDPDVYVAAEGDEGEGHWERGQAGVYGRTYHQSGVPTGEGKPHVLVQLYNAERDRLIVVTREALKAGVERRAIELAEDTARQLADVMSRFAELLGHDPGDPVVREAGRGALLQLAERSSAA